MPETDKRCAQTRVVMDREAVVVPVDILVAAAEDTEGVAAVLVVARRSRRGF